MAANAKVQAGVPAGSLKMINDAEGSPRLEPLVRLSDPASRAAWVYGQPMAACPRCGSYDMKPQTPIMIDMTGEETPRQLLGKWVRTTKAGATPLEGPVFMMCWECGHKGPSVDCSGRTREDVGMDPAVNAEIKRLWNSQAPTSAA